MRMSLPITYALAIIFQSQAFAASDPLYLDEDDHESEMKPYVQMTRPAQNFKYVAINDDESPNVEQTVETLDSRIQIGGNYTYVKIHANGHNSFTGSLGGAQGIYEYRPMDFFYGAAKLDWRMGPTHGHAGKRSLLYIDAQERLGYTFASDDEEWLLTLYSGFGYRHYGENFTPKDGSSVKFNYNEIYVPVGGLVDYAVTDCFVIGLGFAWMPQVYPTVSIVPLKGARWVITNQLANFFVELPLTITMGDEKRFTLMINPHYQYWRDGHTTAKTSSGVKLALPGNTYNFGGIDVNFGYQF